MGIIVMIVVAVIYVPLRVIWGLCYPKTRHRGRRRRW